MASKKQTLETRPSARSEGLLVQHVESETVVYDERVKTSHALRPLAAAVFMYADGNNTVDEIAELSSYRLDQSVTVDEVNEALEQLEASELLDHPAGILSTGISRRTALKTFAAAGAGTMLVSSIVAPFASATTLSNYGNDYYCSYANPSSSGPYVTNNPNGTYTPPAGTASDPRVGAVGGSNAPTQWPIPYVATSGSKWKMAPAGTTGGPVTTDNPLKQSDFVLGGNCYAVGGGSPVYGTYQVVPCDGYIVTGSGKSTTVSSYSCANVVCVPTSNGELVGKGGTASVISGAVISGDIYTDSMAASFSAPSGVVAPGYGVYDDYAYGSDYFFKICCDDGTAANCTHNNS